EHIEVFIVVEGHARVIVAGGEATACVCGGADGFEHEAGDAVDERPDEEHKEGSGDEQGALNEVEDGLRFGEVVAEDEVVVPHVAGESEGGADGDARAGAAV